MNKPEGLEQGFTLAAPPAGKRQGEWLRVALSVGEGWRASLRGDKQSAFFERQADGLRLGYDQLQTYDAQGRTLPARMELAGDTLALVVDDAQAVYPLTIDPIFTQQQKLTAADAAAGDQFGAAVALSGDTAVIGAPLDDLSGVSNRGSVYVFVRSGTSWSLQQKLTASDGVAGDGFGSTVALSGDTVVASAFADDIGANGNQGSAYVFTRSGAAWSQQQKLIANDGAPSDQFGFSVAISGDTVVVGAGAANIAMNADQGAAYVFTRGFTKGGAVWTQQQKLIANDGAADDFFGGSVAVSGDTVVAGAFRHAFGATLNAGAAYVFTRSGAVWTLQQRLNGDASAADDFFGISVALSGDTVVVGAEGDAIGAGARQGSAQVFTRSGGVWTPQQTLAASDGAAGDDFGFSVAISGDAIMVGAPFDAIGANAKQGSAYVFSRSGAVWTQQRKLFSDDGATDDNFGRSVAISGDTVLLGADGDDIGANVNQGSAHVFVICENNHVQQQRLTANDGEAADNFGGSVAVSGDTAVVGAQFDDIGANAAQGSAYVFTRSGTVWTLQQKLTANDGAALDRFGISVAISGGAVVVGAPGDAIGSNANQGSAYVFTRGGANGGAVWTQQQKLTAKDGAAGDTFGFSVALSGDTVVVSAPGGDAGMNVNQGSAYVFTRGGAAQPVWTLQQKLTANDGAALDLFGGSVALSGDTVVVGAEFDDIGANADQGSAYVFTRGGANGGAVWTQQQKLTSNDGAALDNFGGSVAVSGDTAVVGAAGNAIGANPVQGSAYVFTRNGAVWTQQQKLTANDGAAFDEFGGSVAISGDTVVVGADGDDIGPNAGQGSAYVFTRSGAVWAQQQKLTANDGAALDLFGRSIALSGGAVVVGAPLDDIGANGNQGSAYVFVCPACPTITLDPASLPGAIIGASYSQTVTASGGAGPYQFSLSDGALPPGLRLAPNGLLSGTLTRAGAFRFTITATTLSSLCPGSRSFTLTVAQAAPIAIVSAASFTGNSLAPESIVTAFGNGLAKSIEAATTLPLPATLAGTRVSVTDSLGTERDASLFFVSPTQINFQVPPGTASGKAMVTIIHDGETVAAASPQIEMVSPGLFSANASGQGLLAGFALRVKADGSQSFEPVARFDEEKRQFVAAPINLDSATDNVFLVLFGTGVRFRSSLGAVSVKIGGVNAETIYAGQQGSFVGLDQLNVSLPRSLTGRGEVELSVIVDGREANKLKVAIK